MKLFARLKDRGQKPQQDPNTVWHTKDGRELLISELQPDHIFYICTQKMARAIRFSWRSGYDTHTYLSQTVPQWPYLLKRLREFGLEEAALMSAMNRVAETEGVPPNFPDDYGEGR